jgi:hypothetical protein
MPRLSLKKTLNIKRPLFRTFESKNRLRKRRSKRWSPLHLLKQRNSTKPLTLITQNLFKSPNNSMPKRRKNKKLTKMRTSLMTQTTLLMTIKNLRKPRLLLRRTKIQIPLKKNPNKKFFLILLVAFLQLLHH